MLQIIAVRTVIGNNQKLSIYDSGRFVNEVHNASARFARWVFTIECFELVKEPMGHA